MLQWFAENKTWVFSGIGVLAISIFISLYKHQLPRLIQIQRSGKNSNNYQSGRDIIVSLGKEQNNDGDQAEAKERK